jgi:hypothetical protein
MTLSNLYTSEHVVRKFIPWFVNIVVADKDGLESANRRANQKFVHSAPSTPFEAGNRENGTL